jgi:hypothetical protein
MTLLGQVFLGWNRELLVGTLSCQLSATLSRHRFPGVCQLSDGFVSPAFPEDSFLLAGGPFGALAVLWDFLILCLSKDSRETQP